MLVALIFLIFLGFPSLSPFPVYPDGCPTVLLGTALEVFCDVHMNLHLESDVTGANSSEVKQEIVLEPDKEVINNIKTCTRGFQGLHTWSNAHGIPVSMWPVRG